MNEVEQKKQYAIGVDLGGTKILTALVQNDGTIISRIEVNTDVAQGGDAVVNQVLESIQKILNQNKTIKQDIVGIGVATAGVIDTKKKNIVFASNLGLTDTPIGLLIEERFELPVWIGNDANVAVIGEWIWGAGQGLQNIIYITISTGIGAGFISEGRLITGTSDNAGEFGHISIDINGPKCACGNYGCLENYAAGTAIAKLARQKITGELNLIYEKDSMKLSSITSKEVSRAALMEESFAIEILERAGFYIGVGVTNLIHLFNPEIVIFGGGVMNADRILLPIIQNTVKERCIPLMEKKVRLVKSLLGSDAGVMGAAGLIFAELPNKFELAKSR